MSRTHSTFHITQVPEDFCKSNKIQELKWSSNASVFLPATSEQLSSLYSTETSCHPRWRWTHELCISHCRKSRKTWHSFSHIAQITGRCMLAIQITWINYNDSAVAMLLNRLIRLFCGGILKCLKRKVFRVTHRDSNKHVFKSQTFYFSLSQKNRHEELFISFLEESEQPTHPGKFL